MENTPTATAYVAESPTGQVYVGCTIKTIERRWTEHCYRARKGIASPLNDSIREHGEDAFSLRPVFVGALSDAKRAEHELIAGLRSDGAKVLNRGSGGEGVKVYDAPMRALLSRKMTGHWQDSIFRDRMVRSFRQAQSKPEARQKQRDRWKDPEYRARQSAARSIGQKRRWARAGEREKQSAKQNDPAVRARKSEAAKRNAERPEIKAKLIAAAKKGAAVRWNRVES